MPFSYNKLRGRIYEKYKSQESFAKALGVSKNTVSLKMTGNIGFSQKDIIDWSKKLDISEEEYSEYFFS